jgi:hypothetical protein
LATASPPNSSSSSDKKTEGCPAGETWISTSAPDSCHSSCTLPDEPGTLSPDGETPLYAWLAEREQSVREGGALITDDFNPLEKLQVAKAEYYREILLDRMGPMLLAF